MTPIDYRFLRTSLGTCQHKWFVMGVSITKISTFQFYLDILNLSKAIKIWLFNVPEMKPAWMFGICFFFFAFIIKCFEQLQKVHAR